MKCIWLFGLVILCRYHLCVTSCEWLDGIRLKIFGKVEGSGLHRVLIISSTLASVNRFSDCRLLYEVEIPEGVYVNLNSINSSLGEHTVVALHLFNPEATVAQSTSHKILVVANAAFHKKFIISDAWKMPFMLRYHPAAGHQSRSESIISMPVPDIFLDCQRDYELFHLNTCSGMRKFSSYRVDSLSPSWIAVESVKKGVLLVHLPIGNKRYVVPVAVCTVVVIIASLVRVIHSDFASL